MQLLSDPFLTRWLFDVEFVARLLLSSSSTGTNCLNLYEEPLKEWTHIGGPTFGLRDMPLIISESWTLWQSHSQRLRERIIVKQNSF
jgi:hypothetical protein